MAYYQSVESHNKYLNNFDRLERLETGTHDSSEFDKWQQAMRERDAQAEHLAVQRKALENKLTRQKALINKFETEAERKREADALKAEVLSSIRQSCTRIRQCKINKTLLSKQTVLSKHSIKILLKVSKFCSFFAQTS